MLFRNDEGTAAPQINKCPKCGSANVVIDEEDVDEMSEGQASDYEAGLWGSATCQECLHTIDWE
jgi:predicted nucleic-acid-binding Zn-ribbon protein